MIIGFYGKSGSGKTTLIRKVTEILANEGYRIAVIKHIAHGSIDLDKSGKDTYLFREANTVGVIGASDKENIVIFKKKMELEKLITMLEQFDTVDFIFIEGFKNVKWLKKVKVGTGANVDNTVFVYHENVQELLQFLKQEEHIQKILKVLPGFDCARCGFSGCYEMAKAIYLENKTFKDCEYWNPNRKVRLWIGDKEIYLGRFAATVLSNTIIGLVNSLKQSTTDSKIKIEIRRL